MSKPFTYWVRLALVATLCTLITFSPVSAGRLMDRLLHRDACKTSAKDSCERPVPCEPSCLVVPAAPCQMEFAPAVSNTCQPAIAETTACDAVPPCGCDTIAPAMDHVAPAAPLVQPAPVVEKPAPVVEKPAPVVEKPAPVVEKPAPVVEKPAPVVEKTAPVVEKTAPVAEPPLVVKQPDPVVEPPVTILETPAAVIEEPAPTPSQTLEPVVPNPFDAAPAKTPETDIFGDATPASPAEKTPDVLDSPVIEKPAAEPEMPAKDDLGSVFDTPPAETAKPESKVEDIFNFDSDPKPPVVTEPAAPIVEPKPAKTPDNELEDLFNLDKTEKPVAQNLPAESLGKRVTAEVGLFDEMPVNANASEKSTTDTSFLDNLFSDTPSDQSTPAVEGKVSEPLLESSVTKLEAVQPETALPQATLPEATLPEATLPEAAQPEAALPEAAQPQTSEPEATKPAKQEKEVDELDALFGVSAVAKPADFQGAEFRVWVDNSGAYQIKARLSVIYSDKVKLLKDNGKFTTVPLSRLSEADFGYVSWVASNLTGNETSRMVNSTSKPIEPESERK